MPPAGFEPTTPANERSQNDAEDRVAIGVGTWLFGPRKLVKWKWAASFFKSGDFYPQYSLGRMQSPAASEYLVNFLPLLLH